MGCVLEAVLGDVGSKFSCPGVFWRSVATCWQQDGDQERQDEPSWSNIGAASHASRCSEQMCGSLKKIKLVTS